VDVERVQAAARGRKRLRIRQRYQWDDQRDLIGEGTYGLVYRAIQSDTKKRVAIKKFKNTKEGEGISLTACREITLLRELQHQNIVGLEDIFVNPEDKSLYMVFEYAEYDLFEIIRYHQDNKTSLSVYTIKSLMWQLLNGINCMHTNWMVHRDIKPSNILVMGDGKEQGTVKIADFGLARIFQSPLRPLSDNGVVVTIWYRAPELLLGAKHYTRAVDIWAIGCIFAELITTKPLFPGKEKDPTNPNLFQSDQVSKIFQILGRPTVEVWRDAPSLPEWKRVGTEFGRMSTENGLRHALAAANAKIDGNAFDLLSRMLAYDPILRITAAEALEHPYFRDDPLPSTNVFFPPNSRSHSMKLPYPRRAAVNQQQRRKGAAVNPIQFRRIEV
jgi:cyclin-dependent kinase 8/11